MDGRLLGEELAFLVGSAAGEERVHASAWGPAVDAQVQTNGRTELDGALVVLTLDEHRPDGTGFTVVNVFMRDPADGAILLYAFDTLGYPPDPPARGAWGGAGLVLERTTVRGTGRTSFSPTPTGFTWGKQFKAGADEKWQDVVSGTLTTQSRPGRPLPDS